MSSEIDDVFARLKAKQEELERMRRAIAELKADEQVCPQRGLARNPQEVQNVVEGKILGK